MDCGGIPRGLRMRALRYIGPAQTYGSRDEPTETHFPRDRRQGSTNMWTDVKNKSDAFSFDRGSSPAVFLPSPGAPVSAVHGNGSLATVDPFQTAPPVDWGSGIIPGGIAAAVFISFLLALYAVLWKCIGTPPRKKEKKKVKIHEKREQLC